MANNLKKINQLSIYSYLDYIDFNLISREKTLLIVWAIENLMNLIQKFAISNYLSMFEVVIAFLNIH